MEVPNFSTEKIITVPSSNRINENDQEQDKEKEYSEFDLNSSQLEPTLSKHKFRRKKSNLFFFIQTKITSLFNQNNNLSSKEKFYLIILLLILSITFIIKLFIYFSCLIILFRNFSELKKSFTDLLFTKYFGLYLYFIDLFFLFIGLILLFCENFIQLGVRLKLIENIKENSLKQIILCKFLFFLSLGMVPEIIITMLKFKNKNNIILSFFRLKFENQPMIFLILVIYFLYLLINPKKEDEENKIMQIKKSLLDKKNIIMGFLDKYIFTWNNFTKENTKKIKKINKDKNKENKNEEEINNINSENSSINNSAFETLLSNKFKKKKEENSKIMLIKNYLFKEGICGNIKKYLVLGGTVYMLGPIALNGIFGYGYYVFSFTNDVGCFLFKMDLILSFVFGYFLIKLAE